MSRRAANRAKSESIHFLDATARTEAAGEDSGAYLKDIAFHGMWWGGRVEAWPLLKIRNLLKNPSNSSVQRLWAQFAPSNSVLQPASCSVLVFYQDRLRRKEAVGPQPKLKFSALVGPFDDFIAGSVALRVRSSVAHMEIPR